MIRRLSSAEPRGGSGSGSAVTGQTLRGLPREGRRRPGFSLTRRRISVPAAVGIRKLHGLCPMMRHASMAARFITQAKMPLGRADLSDGDTLSMSRHSPGNRCGRT